MHFFSGRCLFYLLPVLFTLTAAAGWDFAHQGDPEHQRLLLSKEGRPVAEFVYGQEELKPFLHIYGLNGERLTEWSADQQFPHHRGIFIGWNRIRSDLGSYDLWHLNNGGRMKVTRLLDTGTTKDGRAFFEAEIEWHAGKKDESGSSLLLQEVRRFEIASEKPGHAVVDATFRLTAARDLRLDGDLQHSGIHFRGSKELLQREDETSYIWEPPLPGNGGRVISEELKWCRLFFPIGEEWYSALEMNHPGNPVEELSWRNYGRFGFFFRKQLTDGETLQVKYRFVTAPASEPEDKKHSEEELKSARKQTAALYQTYLDSLR